MFAYDVEKHWKYVILTLFTILLVTYFSEEKINIKKNQQTEVAYPN